MLKKVLTLVSAFALIMVSGCAQDYGVHQTIEEINEIVGNVAVQGRYAERQALDILFVIDESGSMSDERDSITNTMPIIYNEITGPEFTDLEWRVGVKSTDPGDGGVYGWVDWDDPQADFKLSVLPAASGNHWGESGLDSAVQSMAWDDFFHREDADLLVVFVSDEPDQSSITPETYESLVATYKDPPFEVSEAAIVPTFFDSELTPRCDYAYELGEGYIEVSEVVVDLCHTDQWVTVLDHAKTHVPTLNEVWPLDHAPLEIDSITVHVDGLAWTDWLYKEDENTVYMTTIPDPGTFVTITYLIP